VNFLAHLLLSPPTPDGRLGGLLGDFVKGPLKQAGYRLSVTQAIRLHRRVDSFTDTHPAVRAARSLVSPARRRFAGILVDVFFDHLLARRWECWHAAPLPQFAGLVYGELACTLHPVPPRFAAMAQIMAAQDWLGSYASTDGISLALERIRACSHYGRQCEWTCRGAEPGARRRPDWTSGQGVQRRAAPRQAHSRTGCHHKSRARRCKASPGPNPGFVLRMARDFSGGNASGVRSVNRP
jgi:acyl carrier protein phosphodiesterase